MLDWELKDPWFLALLPLAILVYWLATRPKSTMSYSSLTLFAQTPLSLRQRFSKLPAVLMALGTVALVLALARPRTPEHESRVSRDGIAIMMAVDLSSSMNARDLVEEDRSINRLDVVKDVFIDFVFGGERVASEGRPNDLIGLVTFAGYADSICPLTLDHSNLASIVHDLHIVDRQSEDGTAVGDGLGLAVERLRRSEAQSKIVILLTDGVNNSGVFPPLKSAELAAEFDIKVYCIGTGSSGVAPMPGTDMLGRIQLYPQRVEIDEETLTEIAELTGGKYYRAENRDALAEIYQAIDSLERTEVSEIRYLRYTEHFPMIVAAAIGLLTLGTVVGSTLFRRLP
ncbi:vWA domain-containing protein [Aureliella helgolandensis]|uniref:von Willebrand factor type A domain protein n=1 Tax=Aureliella helgolandensis TaxID=2527968 RepID=A0A518G6U9_9BACT|nr:VWA domain-containing protein [Aureliella helgolandensis]QDV24310.1 von Willebrand factor type A domain protein [Aureliella helgolandensis]